MIGASGSVRFPQGTTIWTGWGQNSDADQNVQHISLDHSYGAGSIGVSYRQGEDGRRRAVQAWSIGVGSRSRERHARVCWLPLHRRGRPGRPRCASIRRNARKVQLRTSDVPTDSREGWEPITENPFPHREGVFLCAPGAGMEMRNARSPHMRRPSAGHGKELWYGECCAVGAAPGNRAHLPPRPVVRISPGAGRVRPGMESRRLRSTSRHVPALSTANASRSCSR